jgi:hypothetical protein
LGALRCDAQPEDLSPAVTYDQQSIEQPERDGRNDKQIHRRDSICVVAQERLPALRRRPSPAHHILGNAGLADLDAKLCRSGFFLSCISAGSLETGRHGGGACPYTPGVTPTPVPNQIDELVSAIGKHALCPKTFAIAGFAVHARELWILFGT